MTAAGVDETERGQEPGRDAENENPGLRFAAFGISRHRLFRDGQGVTTLVGGIGCPLSCRWCINAVCRDPSYKPKIFTSAELYERLKIDDLYFEATNGGVTFGGGEPLLQAAFIREFIGFVRSLGKNWRFAVETSLAVPEENLGLLLGEDGAGAPLVSEWIVDVKDTDPAVYEAYTGLPPDRMRKNLGRLAALCPSRAVVRVPLIPGYNTPEACVRSEKTLRDMGFENIDRFDYILPKGK